MNKVLIIISIIVLMALLVCIRWFEGVLFYDPLIEFFKTDHTVSTLPEFDLLKLLGNVAFRFVLNTILTLAVLWVVFRDKGIIQFSALLMLILFAVLIVFFFFLVQSDKAGDHLALFYVRRFLIQPVFLLLLLPAFYFQKRL